MSKIPDYGHVMTVDKFKGACDFGGFGHPTIKDEMCDDITIKPSKRHKIDEKFTHIVWFNK